MVTMSDLPSVRDLAESNFSLSRANRWKQEMFEQKPVGQFFKISREVDIFRPEKLLKLQIDLGNTNAVMYRDCMHSLSEAIFAQSEKNVVDNTIFIDGNKGSGKSTAMLHAVNQFLTDGWMVVYLPSLKYWTDGSEPYGFSSKTGKYEQPELAAKICMDILKMNSKSFANLKAPEGEGTLASFIHARIKNPMETLTAVIEYLAGSANERYVLLLML